MTKKVQGLSVQHIDFKTPIKEFLKAMGEDPNRSGIKHTPVRFDEAIKAMLSGYDRSFKDENRFFQNRVKYKNIIILKNIDFFSMCEHHLLPFYGYAHVGYIPSDKAYLGISKLARAVDIYARRLQDQENLSYEIAQALIDHGKAKGVAILIEARHLCNMARGIEKKVSIMTTYAYYGCFEGNQKLQTEFRELVKEREKV